MKVWNGRKLLGGMFILLTEIFENTCGTDLFNASVDLDECGKFRNFQVEVHIQIFQK